MTQAEIMLSREIGEVRGEVSGLKDRVGSLEEAVRSLPSRSDIEEIVHGRASVFEIQVERWKREGAEAELAKLEERGRRETMIASEARRSLRPQKPTVDPKLLTWLLGALGLLATAVGAWLAT